MKHRRRLFSVRDPYCADTDKLFTDALRENFMFQTERCKEYKAIAEHEGIIAESISGASSLPPIPTLFFKRHRLKSCRALITATSSGTGGQFSEIGFDAGGLWCGLKMALKIARKRKLLSPLPCHYIIMGYKPKKGNNMAAVKTAYGATLFTPAISRRYILKIKDGKYSPDFDGIIKAVKKLDGSIFPTRFMGFPSYTYFFLKAMDERNIHIRLKKGSKIMLGGGWKQFYAEQADKNEFYTLAERVLGIKDTDIVEFFGAVEHPVLYCDCPRHHLHVPVYGRVVIRDADTLEPVPAGTAGLVDLITPMVKASPILSVMTDDIGVLHDADECGCGIKTQFLEIIGRVAPTDIKTCAAGAAELLKGAMP